MNVRSRTNQLATWVGAVDVREGIVVIGKCGIEIYLRLGRCQSQNIRWHTPFHGKSPRLAGLQHICNIHCDHEVVDASPNGLRVGTRLCWSGFNNFLNKTA